MFTGNRSMTERSISSITYEETGADPVGANQALRKETSDFGRWIVDGIEPCLTCREGLRAVEVIEAARRSAAENGSWMKLPLYPELENL
jgi:predicted dehydrogenase